MCFSATASFVSGAVLCTLGAVTLERTLLPRERAIASVPFIFGVQQIIEGLIWISSTEVVTSTGLILMGSKFLTYSFSFFSLILWPIFLPASVALIEPRESAKRGMRALLLPAAITTIYFIYVMFHFPIYSLILENHIQYHFTTHPPIFISLCYCIGSVVPCFLSTHYWIKGVGGVLGGALIFSHIYFDDSFVSVWCFFSALMSVFIYIHFFLRRRRMGHAAYLQSKERPNHSTDSLTNLAKKN